VREGVSSKGAQESFFKHKTLSLLLQQAEADWSKFTAKLDKEFERHISFHRYFAHALVDCLALKEKKQMWLELEACDIEWKYARKESRRKIKKAYKQVDALCASLACLAASAW
jgi:hypothetical protein